jgi:hypothetical protein
MLGSRNRTAVILKNFLYVMVFFQILIRTRNQYFIYQQQTVILKDDTINGKVLNNICKACLDNDNNRLVTSPLESSM